jgi:PTH1 family peptidyl-tRNA hydrolase
VILLVGLGNPGQRYENTRHNVGFDVVDAFVAANGGAAFRTKFSGLFCKLESGSETICVLKPQIFMNRSGESVQQASRFFKVAAESILVVHDELDLPFGRIQLKKGGGEAGHNGLRSVSQALGTGSYLRLRVGIGRPPSDFRGSGADYVLEAFAAAERPLLQQVLARARDAVGLVVDQGIDRAMNQTNQKDQT